MKGFFSQGLVVLFEGAPSPDRLAEAIVPRTFENGMADPPRRVLRWLPLDGTRRPPGIQGER